MSTQDPKPGRWILPLVIAGLIGFTYIFVNALPPGETSPTDDTVAAADDGADDGGTTTTGEPVDDTSVDGTEAPAPEVVDFLAAIDDFSARSAALATEAQQINDDWDAGGDFAQTRDGLTDIQTRTAALATEISDTEVPEEATESWNVVITSAQTMSTAAADMYDGLVNSSGSEERLAALDTYVTTAADLASGFDLARSSVGG